MALNFLTYIFGSRNERLLKQYRKTVTQINALESSLEKLSDEALRAKTDEFKTRIAKSRKDLQDRMNEVEELYKSTTSDRKSVV